MLILKDYNKIDITNYTEEQFNKYKELVINLSNLNHFGDTGIGEVLTIYKALLEDISANASFTQRTEYFLDKNQCILHDTVDALIFLAYKYNLNISEENDWEKPF